MNDMEYDFKSIDAALAEISQQIRVIGIDLASIRGCTIYARNFNFILTKVYHLRQFLTWHSHRLRTAERAFPSKAPFCAAKYAPNADILEREIRSLLTTEERKCILADLATIAGTLADISDAECVRALPVAASTEPASWRAAIDLAIYISWTRDLLASIESGVCNVDDVPLYGRGRSALDWQKRHSPARQK